MPQYPLRSLVQPRTWLQVTAPNYGILSAESGIGYTTLGAQGATAFVLPSAYPGRNYAFYNGNGHQITVSAAGTDKIVVNDAAGASSINDGGTLGSFISLESTQVGTWVATEVSAAYGGGGGLPQVAGTFTDQASPVIPFIMGHRLFQLSLFNLTSNMTPGDGNQFGLQTSPNLDGTDPDTDNNYASLIGANSADVGSNTFSGGHWNSDVQGGASPLQVNMTIDAGAADARFNAYGGCDQVKADDSRTVFNLQWYKSVVGAVMSFVMIPVNTEPTLRFSGSYIVQALDNPAS